MKTLNIIQAIRNTCNRLAVAVFFILSAGNVLAGITFDAATTASNNAAHASIAWSHTVGAGADAMLVVGVTTESNPDRTITGVNFGSQPLTQVTGARTSNNGGGATVNASDLWYLPAPTAGAATITVTFSGSVSASTVAGAVSLFGVVQGPPEAVATYNEGNGSTYSAAITTLTYGSWLVDSVNSGTGNATFTPTSGQTKQWGVGVGNHAGAGGTREVTPAGATTDTWTTSGSSRRALSVASFAPVTPPSPADPGTSTVSATPSSVPDDGATTSTITVTVRDAGGTPTPNKSVTLTSDRGLETISPAVATADGSGVATFTVKSTTLGDAILTAHVVNDSLDVTETATVSFVNSSACDILTFGPSAIINQGAQTILWKVPIGSNMATLAPTFTTSIHSEGSPTSGSAPGFTGDPAQAIYTVTAQDGVTQKSYTVTVEESPLPVWSGLLAWYDASAGITQDGSGVLNWADQSGYGHVATRAGGTLTLAASAVNSRPAVRLRSGGFMDCAVGMPAIVKEQYVVLRSPNTTWSGGSFFGRKSNDFLTVRSSSYNMAGGTTGFWQDHYPSAVSKNGTALSLSASGGSGFALAPITNYMVLKIVVDNSASAANLTQYPFYQIGKNEGTGTTDFDVAEIIGYSATLSPTDEAKVGAYLADKYAITTTYPLLNVPPAPSGLTATPLLHSIKLDWPATFSAASYNVYRGTTTGVYNPTPIANVAGGTVTYTDTAVIDDTPYFYVVTAVNIIGEGAASNEATTAPTSGNVAQTITFDPLAAKTYGDAPFELSATATSLLPVSFASSDETVATVSGTTVTILKAGTTTITASQPGDIGFYPATPVDQVLTVSMANQTVAFTLASRLVRGLTDPAFSDAATGGASGNPVTYTSSDEGVATVDGSGLVTILAVGTTEIRANQEGTDEYYNAAPEVMQTLIVIPALLPVNSGLACWYDAGQGITTDGSGVASWADSSTLEHTATRASGSPTLVPNDINGRPAVHLRGNSTFFNCAGAMFAKEQYLVVRSPNATWNGSGSFLGRRSNDFLSVRSSSYNMSAGTDGFWQDHHPAAVSKNGVALPLNNVSGSGFHLAPITDYMVLKITVDSSASAANLAQYPLYQIGKNETLGTMDFDVAEIIAYDRALSPAEATAMNDYLTNKYFASLLTYADWAATNYPAFDLSDPDADLDADGMSNREEFAFGLDPTSGSSVNPIVQQLDKTTGQFSYTRTMNTGLTYKVWHSTDLADWASDLSTQGSPTPNGGGVETVPVTLDSSLLTEPKLFVKVTAE